MLLPAQRPRCVSRGRVELKTSRVLVHGVEFRPFRLPNLLPHKLPTVAVEVWVRSRGEYRGRFGVAPLMTHASVIGRIPEESPVLRLVEIASGVVP